MHAHQSSCASVSLITQRYQDQLNRQTGGKPIMVFGVCNRGPGFVRQKAYELRAKRWSRDRFQIFIGPTSNKIRSFHLISKLLSSLMAFRASSRLVNRTKMKPRWQPAKFIMTRSSKMGPIRSKIGISSASVTSLGTLPTKTSLPFGGSGPVQSLGGLKK